MSSARKWGRAAVAIGVVAIAGIAAQAALSAVDAKLSGTATTKLTFTLDETDQFDPGDSVKRKYKFKADCANPCEQVTLQRQDASGNFQPPATLTRQEPGVYEGTREFTATRRCIEQPSGDVVYESDVGPASDAFTIEITRARRGKAKEFVGSFEVRLPPVNPMPEGPDAEECLEALGYDDGEGDGQIQSSTLKGEFKRKRN